VARIAVTFAPSDENVWLGDEADPRAAFATCEAALVFWPRRELQRLGLDWSDAPGLRLVKVATAGVNHVAWDTFPPGLAIASTPGATGPFIAEWLLGAIIAWARSMVYHTHEIRAGRFHQGAPVRGLGELRVGFVGFGGIGQSTARLLAPFGTRMAAVSRTGRARAPEAAFLDWLGTTSRLPELVQQSDVLVVCLPLNQETVGLIDIDLLSGMSGRPAMLANVSRGAVVREADLHAWLDSDATRHFAALDVWWQYPKGEGFPFAEAFHKLPNVLMTPHNSPNVGGFRAAMLAAACRDLQHWQRTGTILHKEDPAAYHGIGGDAR
jgi:phosphoglycerate dehydrogenase-like enzyme